MLPGTPVQAMTHESYLNRLGALIWCTLPQPRQAIRGTLLLTHLYQSTEWNNEEAVWETNGHQKAVDEEKVLGLFKTLASTLTYNNE